MMAVAYETWEEWYDLKWVKSTAILIRQRGATRYLPDKSHSIMEVHNGIQQSWAATAQKGKGGVIHDRSPNTQLYRLRLGGRGLSAALPLWSASFR